MHRPSLAAVDVIDIDIDLDEITVPSYRPLTESELSQLQELLRGSLRLTNCSCALQAQEDAVDLVNYACELLLGDEYDEAVANDNDDDNSKEDGSGDAEDGTIDRNLMTVRAVLEELEIVELEICGPDSLESMRKSLVRFLIGLHDYDRKVAAKNNKALRSQSMPTDEPQNQDGHGRPVERRNSLQSQMRNSEMHVQGIDLSAKTAALQKREELKIISSRGKSIKERMAMYNDQGGLRSSFQNGELDDDDDLGLEDYSLNYGDKSDIDMHRQRDLTEIMNDARLTEKEQTNKMKECRAKYGLAEMKLKIDAASSRALQSKKACDDNKKSVASISDETRAEREMKKNKGRRSSIDLSAKSAVVKKAQELAVLKNGGAIPSLKERMASYEKSTSFHDRQDDGKKTFLVVKEEKTSDDLRREELLQVMKDRSLSKEDKAKKMEQVREKYAVMAPHKDGNETSSTTDSSIVSSSTDGNKVTVVDFSAKSYTDRRRASLQSLEESIDSNEDNGGDKDHVMSLRERLLMYRNNEEIVKC